MKSYFRALTIAGSDSGGGAGIQADLKTFSALGCFGMSAITALTAQNTRVVTGIFPVPPEFIGQQIDAVMEDIGTDAVKIGMLHSPEVIEMVAKKLVQWHCPNIVLDPVMISKSGDNLLLSDAVHALKTILIPKAFIITPNLPEASVLLDQKVETIEDMTRAVKDLASLGCANVLLKGGHLTQEDSCDLLYRKDMDTLIRLPGTRINTPNSHGTGCTLSSAVCANLARGVALETAVKNAKAYITSALAAGANYTTGKGHGPVSHFYALWPEP
ncbi:MAG: bifunctional hydroxymethylpyrimidine kinase/phosphomethylpyrimidine kinase [Proteobacteria bacterium]|nr:bifunctional hydroxymethylpyrimidine kinase/phosphomethylpyrimidine kinase [Pseudomonadota bacterium]MBU1581675.1 bifunctional hydroxymethylpyrimidine kinase/phosphomethylpyrimidine kinase [Pseudomonadota bacterium]MBU2454682.1 bifunctional hydroxymethylpyrimidine kinase/phosphomethylpyrimidine kinase [Pseudomonadota bacterium]MBU2628613.1 bifunctional hydroxymethylpyrimidine kinase/phosphomethylpyrimidine kinase [Pseudomonadota bacterium]